MNFTCVQVIKELMWHMVVISGGGHMKTITIPLKMIMVLIKGLTIIYHHLIINPKDVA